MPALQAARGDVRETLVDGGSGRTTAGGGQQRFRNGLVVAEIAFSLILLVLAGLLLRGFLKVRDECIPGVCYAPADHDAVGVKGVDQPAHHVGPAGEEDERDHVRRDSLVVAHSP